MPAKKSKASKKSARPKAAAKVSRPSRVTRQSTAEHAGLSRVIKRTSTVPAGGNGASASAVSSITPFLWFDNNFEEAAKFYTTLFPNSRVTGRNPMGGSFTLCGQKFIGL